MSTESTSCTDRRCGAHRGRALVGAVHAASNGAALLLVAERSLPIGVGDYLRTKSGLSELFVYGGAAAIADNVVADAQAALDG